MAKKSAIGWTDSTVNFFMGCDKISPGCKYCYMYRMQINKNDPTKIWRTSDKTFLSALEWKTPRRIFTNSMSDFFHEKGDAWRDDAWSVIEVTPQHEWQILTKRTDLIKDRLPANWGNGWDNVILGASIENQDYFYRAHELSLIPSKRRFLSIEPLIGQVDVLTTIEGKRPIDKIDWVIIGGESGNTQGNYRYRPCEIAWIEQIVTDLRREAPHVKIFVKQLGTYLARKNWLKSEHGTNMKEWPARLNHLKIQEYAPPVLETVS